MRCVLRRRRDETGEHRGFGDGDVLDLLAEVHVRGGADAVRAVTEIDVVEIDREDLGLRQLALEANREDQLLHLAAVLLRFGELRAFVGREADRADLLLADEQRLLDDLLGDRRATLLDIALRREIADRSADDADQIEALVAIEAAILGGQERGRHVRRHALERDDLAVLDRERADLFTVGGEDDALAVRLVVEELGQVLGQLFVDGGNDQVSRGRAHRQPVHEQQESEAQDGHGANATLPALGTRRPTFLRHGMLSV